VELISECKVMIVKNKVRKSSARLTETCRPQSVLDVTTGLRISMILLSLSESDRDTGMCDARASESINQRLDSFVFPMCDVYLERYIQVPCTGLYVKLKVL